MSSAVHHRGSRRICWLDCHPGSRNAIDTIAPAEFRGPREFRSLATVLKNEWRKPRTIESGEVRCTVLSHPRATCNFSIIPPVRASLESVRTAPIRNFAVDRLDVLGQPPHRALADFLVALLQSVEVESLSSQCHDFPVARPIARLNVHGEVRPRPYQNVHKFGLLGTWPNDEHISAAADGFADPDEECGIFMDAAGAGRIRFVMQLLGWQTRTHGRCAGACHSDRKYLGYEVIDPDD